mgnify:CR=1 FL=1
MSTVWCARRTPQESTTASASRVGVMYTYDVVSESVKNPHELAAELTQRSRAGWELVQIIHRSEEHTSELQSH